jgi:hypothetical protein
LVASNPNSIPHPWPLPRLRGRGVRSEMGYAGAKHPHTPFPKLSPRGMKKSHECPEYKFGMSDISYFYSIERR